MFGRIAAPVLLALALFTSAPARAAWMWTGWEDTNLPQTQCLAAASGRLKELGFTVTVNPQTTFGWRNGDGVSVRCIAERRLAVIFVHITTTSEEGGQILEELRRAYQGTGTPPATPAPAPAPAPRSGGGSKF
jgi:hypothetical protein